MVCEAGGGSFLLTTIVTVVLVVCGESQQSIPSPETKPVPPLAEAAKPESPTAKATPSSIHEAAEKGKIEAFKQHLAAATDENANTLRRSSHQQKRT